MMIVMHGDCCRMLNVNFVGYVVKSTFYDAVYRMEFNFKASGKYISQLS
jgi:hypothetical protein